MKADLSPLGPDKVSYSAQTNRQILLALSFTSETHRNFLDHVSYFFVIAPTPWNGFPEEVKRAAPL